jgi:hypothetical protein
VNMLAIKFSTLSLSCRALLSVTALAFTYPGTAAAQTQPNSGCSLPPYTSCVNPVPATYLSGSWIEDDASSEWAITANDGAPSQFSNVTGWTAGFTPPSSIIVFPIAFNCPVIYYTVNARASFYSPSSINTGSEGSTSFQWQAINPTPSTACGGYTPVASEEFVGTIANKGNDTGTGTWTNSSGGRGSLAIEANTLLVPTSETLALDTSISPTGFGVGVAQTVLFVTQTLNDSSPYDPTDPNGIRYQGRQVYEQANGTATDGCYQAALGYNQTYPGGPAKVVGSVWNVGYTGPGNQYGDDGLGWTTAGVSYYRLVLPPSAFPCTATFSQAMVIVQNDPGFSNYQFATHTISFTINYPHGVTITKDNITATSAY